MHSRGAFRVDRDYLYYESFCVLTFLTLLNIFVIFEMKFIHQSFVCTKF